MDTQDSNVSKNRLQRLVKDVGHLVFEVLSSHEGVEQVLPEHAFQSDDLATRSTDRRVDVKCLPEVIDRIGSGLSTDIKQDTHACVISTSDLMSWVENAHLGLKHAPKALKNQRWELIFFWFFS